MVGALEDSAATGVSVPGDPAGDDNSAENAGAVYVYTVPETLEAVETVRLGTPPNPAALLPGVTSGPVIGSTWDPVVDHTSFMPGAVVDLLGFFVGPANVSTIYGTLLCQGPLVVLPGAPGVPFRISISLDFSIVGISLCRQAASLDGVDAHLTNALDITIGGM